jgi:ribA/ribD-fused uncharacterized protein
MSKTIDSFTGEYAFLSNFYPVPRGIILEGRTYPSVENAYQAQKCPIDLRGEEWEKYRSCTPGNAKRLGKILPLRPEWENIKRGVMYYCCEQKFEKPELEKLLLNTGDQELIEGNNWGDKEWGMVNGEGKNLLGKILMLIRLHKKLEQDERKSGISGEN